MNHKQKTILGLQWSIFNHIVSVVFMFGFSVILARLLTPSDFGLVAMVRIVLVFLLTSTRFGLNIILIQDKQLSIDKTSSIFWFQLCKGIAFAIIFFLAAPLISNIYHRTDITPIARFMAIVFILSSVNNTHWAMLKKQLNFKLMAKVDLTALIISGTTAVIAAYMGLGYWSLVVQLITHHFLRTVFIGLTAQWRPKWVFNTKYIQTSLGKGLNITGLKILNQTSKNIDMFIIGSYMGDQLMGLYSKAQQASVSIIKGFSNTVMGVMLPSFTQIQDDTKKLRQYYLKVLSSLLTLVIPMVVFVLLQAENLIRLVYGGQWVGMANYLIFFCFLAVVHIITLLNNSVFNALGKFHIPFRIGLVTKSGIVLGVVAGYFINGISGLIIGYFVASVILLIPEFIYLINLIDLRIATIIFNCQKIMIFTAITITLFVIFKVKLNGWAYWVELIVVTVLYAVFYAIFVLIFEREIVIELRKFLQPGKLKITP